MGQPMPTSALGCVCWSWSMPPCHHNGLVPLTPALQQAFLYRKEKDYEIKITTRTPLVIMFSGGSGLKDKMENNQFKTSTFLFFSFTDSSLSIFSLSFKVHLCTGSTDKQSQKFHMYIQSNLPLTGWSEFCSICGHPPNREVPQCIREGNFLTHWRQCTDAIITLLPKIVQFKL